MATLQVRVDDSLKNDAVSIFNNLGIDISTAVKIFLKRVVICNGLPFRMTLPREIYCAERGYRALLEIGEESEKKDFLKCRWMKLMLRLKLSENNDILRNFNVAHVFVLIWLGEINMAGIITNFQAPDNLEDLEEAYNKYQGTNLDGILEDAKKHYTAWTVGRKSQIGDIVFFFCAATAIDKIKKAYREARKADKLIEFAEKQKELYEKFSGHIVAWGRIIAKPCDFDFGWGAEIEVVEAIDIPYSAFKSFIKISTFGAITFLNDEKLSKLEELVGIYNEGELETIVVKPALREGKRIEVYGTKYERNAKIRREFLSKQAKPYKCAVCGFDYEKHYGQLGKDYIEVHHKTPLSVNGHDVEIDLENDLVCFGGADTKLDLIIKVVYNKIK